MAYILFCATPLLLLASSSHSLVESRRSRRWGAAAAWRTTSTLRDAHQRRYQRQLTMAPPCTTAAPLILALHALLE